MPRLGLTARIPLYVAGLAAVFFMAAGIDRVVGPLFAPPGRSPSPSHHTEAADPAPEMTGHPATAPPSMPSPGPTRDGMDNMRVHDHKLTPERGLPWIPGGLQVVEDGYAIKLLSAPQQAGRRGTLTFRITGPDGRPVTAYTPTHQRPLHLIVIRRDLTGYRHVHPTLSASGTWSTPLTLDEPGTYRVFADFEPRGRGDSLILGTDLLVPGDQEPAAPPADGTHDSVDGYAARVSGTLRQGQVSRLTSTLSRNGRPVTSLQPYLGAYGHLIALRSGDLAYLHVHPIGTPGDGKTAAGPAITFDAEVPSAGTYRLFLDFQDRGVVRTATFTVTAAG